MSVSSPRSYVGNTRFMATFRPAIGSWFYNQDEAGRPYQWDGEKWQGLPPSGKYPKTPTPRIGTSGGMGGGLFVGNTPPVFSAPSKPGPGSQQPSKSVQRCGVIATPTGFYPPNLGPVSIGSGNVVYDLIADSGTPVVPTPGYLGTWNFPDYNNGGVDYASDCDGNKFRAIVGGNGYLSVNTVQYLGFARLWVADLHEYNSITLVDIIIETKTGAFGHPANFIVTGADPVIGTCYHYVDVYDNGPLCGQEVGYNGFNWTQV